MARFEPLHRRAFISQVGKGVLSIAVLGGGLVACADGEGEPATTVGGTSAPQPGQATTPPTTAAPPASSAAPTTSGQPAASGVSVERVNLGFVSAYVLVRNGQAAIVDTGVAGSTDAIEESLSSVGLAWNAVGDVVLTHLHGDHIGSVGPVMSAAAEAVGYAGAEDIPSIASPRPLVAVATGDIVFGLDIISTPGHTPGHISVYDPVTRALVAGDAINGAGSGAAGSEVSGVGGPNPDFTADMATALASVAAMADLEPEAIFFGHGEPLLEGAADALRNV